MNPILNPANLAALNDQSLFFPRLSGSPAPGQVYAANDSAFDAQFLSQPLTEYAVGYPDVDGLEALLDAAAPVVPVGRSFSYLAADDKEDFQADTGDQDIRALGGDFAQIRRTGSKVDGRTDNKGLTMVIDDDAGGGLASVQQRAVANLRQRLMRTELYRLVTLLEANDTQTGKNWGTSATKPNPDADVLSEIDTSGDARGINANVVLYGGGAWVKRLSCLLLTTSTAAGPMAPLTAEQLASWYGVDSVLLSSFRRQSTSSAKAKVVGDTVYIYHVRKDAMPDDPSNIKRFVTLTDAGQFRVYVEQRLKRWLLTVEHYSRLVCTSTLGIRSLAITYT